MVVATPGETVATGETPNMDTTVSLTPANSTVEIGETTTYDVTVDQVENGIKSYEFDVALNDSTVATITDVTLQGTSADDTLTSVEFSEDNTSLSVKAGSADHKNGVIATVTVQTHAAGSVGLSVSDVAVGDAIANSYDISETEDATMTVNAQSTAVKFVPSTKTVPHDGTSVVDVVVANPASGIASYSFDASVADTNIATIEDVSIVGSSADNSLTAIDISEDGSSTSVDVAVGDHDEGKIASITVRGNTHENTTLSLSDVTVGDAEGDTYAISSLDTATIQVKGTPEPVVGEKQPTDTDGDGRFEDINGDGTVDIVDVSALFKNRNSPQIQNSEQFYDINGDGSFNIVDVNALFKLAP